MEESLSAKGARVARNAGTRDLGISHYVRNPSDFSKLKCCNLSGEVAEWLNATAC